MAETIKEIPWEMFCEGYGSPPSRYLDIDSPFIHEGFKYATDSRIAIRVPATGECWDTENRIPKSITKVGWHLAEGANWRPWPEREQPVAGESIKCNRCNGKGGVKFSHWCAKCQGSGAVIEECPHCGHDMDEEECDRCDGKGVYFRDQCGYCGGRGEGELLKGQPVGLARISGDYDDRIRQLPGPIEYVPPKSDDGAILFRFDGGEGVIMPLMPGTF